MSDEAVLLSIPDPADAPGIRAGITQLSQWRLNEITPGWGAIEPAEGAHQVYPYFTAHKLCDAQTTLTDETWEPLRRNPAWSGGEIRALRTSPAGDPDLGWQTRLLEWGKKIAAGGRRGSEFAAISATLTALDPSEVPEYLQGQVALLFNEFPDGSLWFLEVDRLFTNRAALLRLLLALETIPDFISATKQQMPQVHGRPGAG